MKQPKKTYDNIGEWYEQEFRKEMDIIDPGIIQPDIDDLSVDGLKDVIETFLDWHDGLWGTWE